MCIERRVSARSRSGFSLIELIMFIAIVGAALAGVLSVLNVTVASSADPMVRKQMLSIAESLLDEVTSKPFTVCDPEDVNAGTAINAVVGAAPNNCATKVQGFGQPAGPVANRSFFNNVGNYCNEVGTGGTTCTTLTLGTPSSAASQIPDLTGLHFSPPGYWATMELIATDTLGGIASAATTVDDIKVLRVRVTVSYFGTSENVVLEGYRTRWMRHL
jgi:MSHA pilin protein MshD